MKYLAIFVVVVGVVSAQTGPNLSTGQGVQQFLANAQINPSTLVTSNCIMNGNPCSTSGGQPCCLSPIFSCQSNPMANGARQCLVVPAHVQQIPQIRQILQAYGVVTPNPVM